MGRSVSEFVGWLVDRLCDKQQQRYNNRVALSNGGPDNPPPRIQHSFSASKGKRRLN